MQRLVWACGIILSFGCGGNQRAPGWPSVPTETVAGAAAGAAALMTIANPNGSVRKPEKDPSTVKPKPGEQMPASVLDSLDHPTDESKAPAPVPCASRPAQPTLVPDPNCP
jgi:hypothetical protein